MTGGVPGRIGSARGIPPTPPNSIFEYSNIDVAISVPKKNEKKIKKSVDIQSEFAIIVFKLMQRLHQRNQP